MSQFDWLDTETKSILSALPPDKLIAAATESFSLLLLQLGQDQNRTEEVVAAIRRTSEGSYSELPFVVSQRMTLDDALAGQLALVCCDCISAFVADQVATEDNWQYLSQLLRAVQVSPEFEHVRVRVDSIPPTKYGKRFCWQFLGSAVGLRVPLDCRVFRKKARLMEHWAPIAGVDLSVEST